MLRFIILMIQLTNVLCQNIVVNTAYGGIRGKVQEFNGKFFTAFLGIPYAAPPVGDLRFRPAQRHGGWRGNILDAFSVSAACPQYPGTNHTEEAKPSRLQQYDEDEDCLYLNIYVPGDFSNPDGRSLPVVVFIHGGGFSVWSASFQIGDAFVTDAEPVVMVTIQYRLGVLGFLSSGDEALPGNLGLKDQTFALKWVKENIAQFGGNPDQVTICGESAGGESVLAHMISPMSAGLFQRAIAQSTPLAWIYQEKELSKNYFIKFAESLDCKGPSEAILECLRGKTWRDLIAIRVKLYYALYERVIDGEFITDSPGNLWAKGLFNDAELMVGFTSDEGSLILKYFSSLSNFVVDRSNDLEIFNAAMGFVLSYQLSDDKYRDRSKIFQNGYLLKNFDDLLTVVKGRYYDSSTDELQKGRGIIDSLGDGYFNMFSLFVANQVAQKGGKVRVYVFDHRSEFLGLSADNEVELRAPHTHEITYQFGYGLTDASEIPMTGKEVNLTHSVIQAWTSFVTGKASYLSMHGETIEWPLYTLEEKNVLVFNTEMSQDSIEDGEEAWQPVLDFWLAIRSLAQFEDDGKCDVLLPSTSATYSPNKITVIPLAICVYLGY